MYICWPKLYIVDYRNSESNLRRYIKHCIEKGNLKDIRKINNLTPRCPYNGLDPIYTAVDNNKLDIIKYLVEERKLKSKSALAGALDCGYIDIAEYLYNNNFPLLNDDYVFSIEVMKLVNSWSNKFSKNAIDKIINMCNTDIIGKLTYLFSIISVPTMKIGWFERDEERKNYFASY